LACDWTEYISKGGDISEFRHATGYTEWLPLIAIGRLTAEAVLKFAHDPEKLRLLDSMPAEAQKDLANGRLVEYFNDDKGQVESRPLITVPNKFARRVISAGEIVPVEEQRRLATKQAKKKPAAKAPKCDVSFDKYGNGKSKTRTFTANAVMFRMKAMSALRGVLEQAKGKAAHPHIVVPFCEHDKQLIEALAEAAGCSTDEWIRSACGAFAFASAH
jgi:hypothetical protein